MSNSNTTVRYLPLGIQTAGFSMVEVTLAIGILGFCLLAVIGLLPLGLDGSMSLRSSHVRLQHSKW